MSSLQCGDVGVTEVPYRNLRIASIFIIAACSMSGALFPILAKRSTRFKVPTAVFDFAKYFGSGVIIATAFIHLLSPAMDELDNPCLSPAWGEYPYALAFCLLSIFSIFIVELIAFRWGTAKLAKMGIQHDAHGHNMGGHAAHGPEIHKNPRLSRQGVPSPTTEKASASVLAETDIERGDVNVTQEKLTGSDMSHGHHDDDHGNDDLAFGASSSGQILGVAILEFGVVLHSILVGLTLAVDPAFKILFIVLIFHQTFEGLAVGSRLAYLNLPSAYRWIPYAGGALFGLTTPIGIAVGLGISATYNPGSTAASIVSGVMDSLSAGILIYTGLVELLAHEFLFNKDMMTTSNGHLAYAIGCMLSGCALMALLGKWA